ncbi:MAG: MutT/NUDIX family protein [Bryobacterales bacterium]|nr:MutT/NUDIX family protein [Bryobacterales bacterium]
MIARFAPVELHADASKLSAGDQKALPKLLDAARVIDDIFLTQVWSGNPALRRKLVQDKSEVGKARLHYFDLNKGPWSELDDHVAFLPDVPPKKLPGANFYPEDMTKAEFEMWADDAARGFFTVIRRDADKKLRTVPYSIEYKSDLSRAAKLLEEAAALTPNKSLQEFLRLRAKAFSSNDYYDSDVAWMKLDAPIDITIGPYETYMDEIFGYKAAFEAYVTLRDDEETAKLKMFADHLQEIENNLPLDPKYRNPQIGALAPIRVVNQVLAAGDGAHGVRTAAFNLPNDERIVQKMGSKRVMLKNVQEAKFSKTLEPIAKRVLGSADQRDLNFNAFFTHILAHEMTHGIGPQNNVRQSLKELHSAIEEAKADATGLFMMQYLFDHKLLPAAEKSLYTTFLASSFRTLRFGIHEAHGKGMALQFNYLMDKGAFVARPDGTFAVDFAKIQPAVRDLVHDLLTIEATGDYAGAKKMLDQLSVVRPPVQQALGKLTDIPTDIEPVTTSR